MSTYPLDMQKPTGLHGWRVSHSWSILSITMSIDKQSYARPIAKSGVYESAHTSPLSLDFEKVKSAFGFVEPCDQVDGQHGECNSSVEQFNRNVRDYIGAWSLSSPIVQHESSDVFAYRGILVAVAQLYYEHDNAHPGSSSDHKARRYQTREYLSVVYDDMRFLNEPPSEHLDKLLYDFGIKDPRLPDPKLVRFSTNIMTVLRKIDHNLEPLFTRTK